MQAPTIDSKLLFEILKNKGVQNLHHANTVKTSLTFINEGSLLSRSYVETKGLTQTGQYTDAKDKIFNIWDSVFLDGTDLHRKYLRPNKYGPILFYIDLEILLSEDFSKVSVTKSNPDSWHSLDNKFYESVLDIDRDYLTGDKLYDGRIMFLFDSPQKKITINKYCKKIIIDDPRINLVYPNLSSRPIADLVKDTITFALQNQNLNGTTVEIRHVDNKPCNCYFKYKTMYANNKIKFDLLFQK